MNGKKPRKKIKKVKTHINGSKTPFSTTTTNTDKQKHQKYSSEPHKKLNNPSMMALNK